MAVFVKGVADARYTALAGAPAVRIEPTTLRFLQLKDAASATWLSLWLASGALQTGEGSPAVESAVARAMRLKPGAQNFIQLKDAASAQFRSVFLTAGALQCGSGEA